MEIRPVEGRRGDEVVRELRHAEVRRPHREREREDRVELGREAKAKHKVHALREELDLRRRDFEEGMISGKEFDDIRRQIDDRLSELYRFLDHG